MNASLQWLPNRRVGFICSSLAPGRDGVGDYTRRLAAELVRRGWATVAVALNDPQVSERREESQEMEGAAVPVLRLPAGVSWRERMGVARKRLAEFEADWLSLQLVPFGFHPKGLCFELGRRLASLKPRIGWHLMVHELWLGLGEHSPVKHRLWGALQRRIVLDVIRRLRPKIIHTQAEPYRIALKREKIDASILPLHGNIPPVGPDGWGDLLAPVLKAEIGEIPDRRDLYLAGVLGRVHPEWNAADTVGTLLPQVERFNKRLVLVFHGQSGVAPETFGRLRQDLHGRADLLVLGERPDGEISRILHALDLGLATSPRRIIQKSGSVAAMVEHGLPILVTRDDWRLRGSDWLPNTAEGDLLTPAEFAGLQFLPTRAARASGGKGVKPVADSLMAALEASNHANTDHQS